MRARRAAVVCAHAVFLHVCTLREARNVSASRALHQRPCCTFTLNVTTTLRRRGGSTPDSQNTRAPNAFDSVDMSTPKLCPNESLSEVLNGALTCQLLIHLCRYDDTIARRQRCGCVRAHQVLLQQESVNYINTEYRSVCLLLDSGEIRLGCGTLHKHVVVITIN